MAYICPSILVCTVGTSLDNNLKRINPQQEQDAQIKAILERIEQHYQSQEFPMLARELLQLPTDMRLLGAEINSVAAMQSKNFISPQPQSIILLTSDTELGERVAKILQSYFTDASSPIRFKQGKIIPVEGLQDKEPMRFRTEGLVNLVRNLGEQLRQWGKDHFAINATGGYKAQIALAVAFGQVTQTPVYYKHEFFDQIISFPRIPFTMDLSLVSNHLPVWANLAEPGRSFNEQELHQLLPEDRDLREQMHALLEYIEEEEKRLYSLSSLGMVYWEAFCAKNPQLTVEPKKVDKNKRLGCNMPQHHYPIGFEEYMHQVYDSFPEFITECHTTDYCNQRGIQRKVFYQRQGEIVAEYVDRNQFGARFVIKSMAMNSLERQWLIDKLQQRFC